MEQKHVCSNQHKKEYLQQYREVGAEVRRLEREIERWRAQAGRVTSTLSALPKGGGSAGRQLEDNVIRIDELAAQLAREQSKLITLRLRILCVINSVHDLRQQRLLRLRYIDGMTWEQIAVELNYSYRQTTRLHGEALSNIKDVLVCPTQPVL